jgi:hypothetical protein
MPLKTNISEAACFSILIYMDARAGSSTRNSKTLFEVTIENYLLHIQNTVLLQTATESCSTLND